MTRLAEMEFPVTVTRPVDGRMVMMPMKAADLLAVPTTVTGIFDEGHATITPGELDPHMFGLSIPWLMSLAGKPYDEVNQLAAELAGHAAALDENGWPGPHAHVRCFPVVDFGPLLFKVTPQYVPPAPNGMPAMLRNLASAPSFTADLTAALAKMADDAELCDTGGCDCLEPADLR